jgi:imidazolonepropionase-like amidohydrolase
VTGGHAWALGGEADGPTDVVRTVRRLRKEGADLLKIMTTGGFMTPGSRPWESRFSEEELAAACDEAHRIGMKVTTHALSVEGIARAVRAGVDSIEHCGWVTHEGIRFDPEVAALIAERGVFVCPTMNSACVADPYFCPWGPREDVVTNLRRMREAGITLITGTDCGIPLVPADGYHDGLLVMAESGMSPREVVQASTSDAARACGLDGETGRLEEGLAADIIGVPGDPTEDLDVLRDPQFVMAGGRVHPTTPPREIRTEEYRREAHQLVQQLHEGSGRAPDALCSH